MTSIRWMVESDQSGLFNMGADAAAIESLIGGLGEPVFRLYNWSPWCLSIGYHQKADEVNFEAVRSAGAMVVRRPTGGRAVFHANEITYSCIIPLGDLPASVWYERLHEAIRRALLLQSVETVQTSASDEFRTIYQQYRSAPCFISSAQSELLLLGRKVVGSAQRQYGPVLLQHGSIPVDQSHEAVIDFLNWNSQEEKESARTVLKNKAACLQEANPAFSIPTFYSDLRVLFGEVTGFEAEKGEWMPEERELIAHLSKKYRVNHEY